MIMKKSSHVRGKEAEGRAEAYLREKGYVVRERNYRWGRGEVDLIVERDGFLLFVEVKVRTSVRFGYPESFVTCVQQERYHEVATYYVEDKGWKGPIRFDIIAITPRGGSWDIVHFEDAF